MRIKFLSIIASFFMVSFVITSCLNDDNNVEYSPDATIHAFGLDTVYGKHYKFTIDQLTGEIYNRDSMPVHADTILDRILIDTLTTASGIVTVKDSKGQDSILNISDSIDLRKYINAPEKGKYLELKVWAPDMVISKTYKLSVRVHLQDPDSLNWGNAKGTEAAPIKIGFSGGQVIGKQKAVLFNNHIYVYSIINNKLAAYKTAETDGRTWTPVNNIQGVDGANAADLSSIIVYDDNLYMVANNKVYKSDNGSAWNPYQLSNQSDLKFATLLAAIQPDTNSNNTKTSGISAIASSDGGATYQFYMTNEIKGLWEKGENLPGDFPTKNISSTVSFSKTGVPFIVAMGAVVEKETTEPPLPIVPWSSYNGLFWVDLSTSTSYCPMLNVPSIFAYNEALYAFGDDFKTFYTSPSGITWKEANKKFYFPKGLTKRAGDNYSIVVDNNHYIWIICSKNIATGGGDDVWRGRLNKLGFKKY